MDTDYFLSLFSGEVIVNPVTFGAALALIIASLLLLASGFISGSEIAFFSLKPIDIEEIKEEKNSSDAIIARLLGDSEYLLATILIVNNFVNVGVVTLCGYAFNQIFDFSRSPFLGFFYLTVVLTAVLLLFGEIMPKVYAGQCSLKFARVAASTLSTLEKLCRPISYFLIRSTNIVNKKVTAHHHTQSISMDDLSQALELTSDEEMEDEKDILEGVIKFRGKEACEVMTPRIDICDISINSSYTKVLELVRESGYSRIPVYGKTHDEIKGILYIKDLLLHLDKPDTFRWQTLIRPAFFVPETKKIDNLLEDFKTRHIHMAIVVDEYGGISGLVTIEDVVEEIVGEISDEYDEEEKTYVQIDENTYDFEAKTLLIDFFKITGIDEKEFEPIVGEADTLAGLILELKGEFPVKGEKIVYEQYIFSILAVDNRRIVRIRFHIDETSNQDHVQKDETDN